jgi:transcriptional regulator with PAS, ATPase and Fis domain
MQDLYALVPRANPSEERVITLDSRVGGNRQAVRASAIVFSDPASAAIKETLERLAPSDASLVIIGETGTGKEVAARFIHDRSGRRKGPFLAVNCGAFVESLIEAELFGYEKGAFTNALKTQPGWFEAANNGTLLLDEIGDLPLPLQVKLLRVLQEREIVRVGARTPVPVDVRVIAATNLDLAAAVAEGKFRQDLFFRLNVATIVIPPLRDRPGDIRELSAHFLALHRNKLNRPELSLTESAQDALAGHAWPGNIRELENVIHNAVLLAPGPAIDAADLRLSASAAEPNARSLEDELRSRFERYLNRGEPELLARVMRVLVMTGFNLSEANQVRAAERLGISRNAMRTHLANLGVIAGRAPRNTARGDASASGAGGSDADASGGGSP